MKTFHGLPSALAPCAQQERWDVWRQETNNKGKPTKVPYQARHPNKLASSKDPATWSDFPTALRAYEDGHGDGVVLCLLGADLTALDLDDCRNATTGEIEPAARDLIARARSYVEITPSGAGLRIIGKGSGPKVHRKQTVPGANGMSVEAYRDCERFITVTGNALPEAAPELADNDSLLDQVVAELDAAKAKAKRAEDAKGKTGKQRGKGKKLDLDDLIKNGEGGHFGGDRSRACWFVMNRLLELGKSADEIVTILIDPANGISAHCLDQPNPEQHARRQVEKAQKERADDPDVEIERLARLAPLDYEQQRKDAAERLDVRTSFLDRMVAAERVKLGLDDVDDGRQGRAIVFSEPEPWLEPVDGAALLNGMAAAIRRHVVLSKHSRNAAALWVLHAYLIEHFLVSPRLGVRSPTKRCGKTLFLDVLGRLVPRPLPTANVTPAAIFRVIEAYRPTLLVDEADTFLYDNDELRGVLNSGHRKGGTVLRTVGEDHEPRAFATYSPCAIALIGDLPDTLNDRAVAVDLKRRLAKERIRPFRPDRAGELDALARKAARWAHDHAAAIAAADPAMPSGIINREADNWRPLLAIADVAAGKWPQRARAAALVAHAAAGDDDASRLEFLLGDIRKVFTERETDRISSAKLVKELVALEGRPWAEMGKARKPLTQNRLARMLKPLGIIPENIRVGDKVPKGYVLKHFEEAFARYLPQEGASEPLHRHNGDETGTSGPFQSATPGTGVADRKCEKPNNDEPCSGIADEKGGSGGKARVQTAGGEPGLSQWRLRDLARAYEDRYQAEYDATGNVNSSELDTWLRTTLAGEVSPERVETEFERVMQVVFAM